MDLRQLIFLILFYLSVGTFASFGLVREKEVGSKYFLIHSLIVLGLALLSYFFLAHLESATAIWFFIFLGAVGVFSFTAGKKKAISRAVYFLGVIAGVGVAIMDITFKSPHTLHNTLIANALLSMGMMGFSMAAMLLGHWYLTQPKMSIDELKRVTLITIFIIAIRFAWGTVVVGELLWDKSEAEIYHYLLSSSTGIFLMMRWVWGLFASLVLSYFIWQTVKIRSTQSATGLLYILVLFVMTGEILSQYLAFFYGMAL